MKVVNKVEVYDIETLASCFTYTGLDKDTLEVKQFVIHKDLNQLEDLVIHLKSLAGGIGFNNLTFDYPIIHYLLLNYEIWLRKNKNRQISNQDIVNYLYIKAQQIIEIQNRKDFTQSSIIRDKDCFFKQLDLFKLWHYNNPARSTSLKSLQIAMKMDNVMDMPISHEREDIKLNEVDSILQYNLHDVIATHKFYLLSREKIDLRKSLSDKYGINFTNFPNSKLGEYLLLKIYCDKTGKDFWETKKLRTYRESIVLDECLFDYIKFKTSRFQKLLDDIKLTVVVNTKGEFKKTVVYKNSRFEYGTGGLHQSIKAGVYNSDDEWILKDADVSSYYPNIPIQNKLFPEHLGIEFCDVYEEEIVGVRMKEKAKPKGEGDNGIIEGFKEAANIAYGKSNDEHSFLYDPKYTLSTTINGQLLLTMLIEELYENIPDLEMIQVNTDGITIRIKRKYEELYNQICKNWEKESKLVLEYVDYDKMVIRDVNNYFSVTTEGKVKYKGVFEIDKDYHKDNSFRIVQVALSAYFIHNIPIEKTIREHGYEGLEIPISIFDYCGRQKFNKDSHGEIHEFINNKLIIKKQQKNVRYYIAKNGSRFIKQYTKGTTEIINKGFFVNIYNKHEPKEDLKDYNIDYSFYIKEAYKEINVIENKQLELF